MITRKFVDESKLSAGARPGRYRFKREPGAPDPDACAITLTGRHIPHTLQRALD